MSFTENDVISFADTYVANNYDLSELDKDLSTKKRFIIADCNLLPDPPEGLRDRGDVREWLVTVITFCKGHKRQFCLYIDVHYGMLRVYYSDGMEPEQVYTLKASSNKGRFDMGGSDISTGQPLQISVGRQWIRGTVQHGWNMYVTESRDKDATLGYYFECDKGNDVCGLCLGMKVKKG